MHQRAREAFLRRGAGACMDIFAPSLKYRQADGNVWSRIGGGWRIVEVEVMEEKVTPAPTRFGLR